MVPLNLFWIFILFFSFQFLQTFKSRILARVEHHWRWRCSVQVKKQSSMWRLEHLLLGWRWEQPHLNNFQCLFSFSFWVWLGSGLEYEMMNKYHHYGGTLNLDMLLYAQIIHQSWSNKEKHFNDSAIVHFVTNRSTLMNQILSYIQMRGIKWFEHLTFFVYIECLSFSSSFKFLHILRINYESNFNGSIYWH